MVIPEASPSASSSFSDARIIWPVCQEQFAQHTCPQCNYCYCSLQCYKRHTLQCIESFMHENVMKELQQLQPEDETKRKMLDILKRFHSEEEMNSGGEDCLFYSSMFYQVQVYGVLPT